MWAARVEVTVQIFLVLPWLITRYRYVTGTCVCLNVRAVLCEKSVSLRAISVEKRVKRWMQSRFVCAWPVRASQGEKIIVAFIPLLSLLSVCGGAVWPSWQLHVLQSVQIQSARKPENIVSGGVFLRQDLGRRGHNFYRRGPVTVGGPHLGPDSRLSQDIFPPREHAGGKMRRTWRGEC